MSQHQGALRRTKIVCTIGPASDGPEMIGALIEAGMDVARLNFSHGTHDDHGRRAGLIREASRKLGKPIAILQDLSGPKIRTGRGVPPLIETGQEVTLVEGSAGDARTIAVEYEGLATDVHPGDVVRLDDGRIVLRVARTEGGRVQAIVEQGGPLRDRMGVNLPSRRVRLAALTDKDRRDLEFGLSLGVDYVALSFVKRADDVIALRRLCAASGHPTRLVAKVETPEAVENLWEVVAVSDAVMVARGDLGVELSPAKVPVVQKEIVGTCRLQQKPVIVATEMLQSMVESTRPTRAEATDVAAAVFEGADAVMLSAETASGKHPREACAMMGRIIGEAEGSRFYAPPPSEPGRTAPEAIAHAACNLARDVGARVLVAFTQSGSTPRLISKARPLVPIVAFAHEEALVRPLALYWGVVPLTLEPEPELAPDVEALAVSVRAALVALKLVESGDRFVMAFGAPVGQGRTTNALRIIDV